MGKSVSKYHKMDTESKPGCLRLYQDGEITGAGAASAAVKLTRYRLKSLYKFLNGYLAYGPPQADLLLRRRFHSLEVFEVTKRQSTKMPLAYEQTNDTYMGPLEVDALKL